MQLFVAFVKHLVTLFLKSVIEINIIITIITIITIKLQFNQMTDDLGFPHVSSFYDTVC